MVPETSSALIDGYDFVQAGQPGYFIIRARPHWFLFHIGKFLFTRNGQAEAESAEVLSASLILAYE